MPVPNRGRETEFMTASGAQPGPEKFPATYTSAVIRFITPEDAAKAFDVLGEGGQYGVVGEYTYVVTRRHISLLNEAKISYEIESKR